MQVNATSVTENGSTVKSTEGAQGPTNTIPLPLNKPPDTTKPEESSQINRVSDTTFLPAALMHSNQITLNVGKSEEPKDSNHTANFANTCIVATTPEIPKENGDKHNVQIAINLDCNPISDLFNSLAKSANSYVEASVPINFLATSTSQKGGADEHKDGKSSPATSAQPISTADWLAKLPVSFQMGPISAGIKDLKTLTTPGEPTNADTLLENAESRLSFTDIVVPTFGTAGKEAQQGKRNSGANSNTSLLSKRDPCQFEHPLPSIDITAKINSEILEAQPSPHEKSKNPTLVSKGINTVSPPAKIPSAHGPLKKLAESEKIPNSSKPVADSQGNAYPFPSMPLTKITPFECDPKTQDAIVKVHSQTKVGVLNNSTTLKGPSSSAQKKSFQEQAQDWELKFDKIVREYQSANLFVFEVTRYEILIMIIRQCISESQAAQIMKQKVQELLEKYGKHQETPVRDELLKASKAVPLKAMLEHIRIADMTGQMLQCIGLIHLAAQFRLNKHMTRVTSTDVAIFHYFINVHFSELLEAYYFNRKDSESGIVALHSENECTLDSLAQFVDQIEQSILKQIFSWPKTNCFHTSKKTSNTINQLLFLCRQCEECINDKTSKTSEPKSQNDDKCGLLRHNVLTQPHQEALGSFFLKDFMYRWYMNQCENSIDLSDSGETDTAKTHKDIAYLTEVKNGIVNSIDDELNGDFVTFCEPKPNSEKSRGISRHSVKSATNSNQTEFTNVRPENSSLVKSKRNTQDSPENHSKSKGKAEAKVTSLPKIDLIKSPTTCQTGMNLEQKKCKIYEKQDQLNKVRRLGKTQDARKLEKTYLISNSHRAKVSLASVDEAMLLINLLIQGHSNYQNLKHEGKALGKDPKEQTSKPSAESTKEKQEIGKTVGEQLDHQREKSFPAKSREMHFEKNEVPASGDINPSSDANSSAQKMDQLSKYQ